MSFHINPHTGGIRRCEAQTKCPFGGASGKENHFASIKEAKAAFEAVMANKTLMSHQREQAVETVAKEDPAKAMTLATTEQQLKEARAYHAKLNNIFWNKKKSVRDFDGSPEWFKLVQDRKKAYYRMLALQEERIQLLPEDLAAKERQALEDAEASQKARNDEWFEGVKANSTYSVHPELDTPATEREARKAVLAFSGVSEEQLQADLKARWEQGMTKTEAYRDLWNTYPLRTDKALISLDLEIAAPLIKGRVDQGPYSTIIEVGWIKRAPSGTCTKKSYLCGIPDDLRKSVGTGAQHIHNISPEMLEEMKPLQEDEPRMQEILKELKGSVLVAHMAKFEVGQFRHNIPGFADLYDSGEVEVLDTREVTRFFHPETENNTNEAFVTATGGKYEQAHRAYEDALMTMNALMRSTGNPETKAR